MRTVIQRNRAAIFLAVLVFGQLLMIGQQLRTASGARLLSFWSSVLLLPLQKGAQATLRLAAESWDRYVWLVGSEREKRRLDAEAARLRIENHYLRRKLERFESRADLEAYRLSLQSKTLAARVIAAAPSRTAKEVFIDRGRSQGVQAGMAVVTPNGIVGKVEVVHGSSSRVLLINDTEAGVGIMLAGSGEPGVLRGTGQELCRVDYVSPHVRVADGEDVFTSGLDGVYSRGLPVGTVTSVGSGLETRRIQVQPFADLDRLDEVLIVLEGEHEALPQDVRARLARTQPDAPDRDADAAAARFARTDADRIKQTYRRSVESQGRKIGQLSGTGPPDFEGAAEALRSSGLEPSAGQDTAP